MIEDTPHSNGDPRDYRFRFTSGRLSLDLLATVADRGHGADSYDRWRSTEDLDRWCLESGLLQAPPHCTADQLAESRALREALYRVVQAGLAARRPGAKDLATVNTWAARPTLAPRLEADGRSSAWTAERPWEAVMASAARDAVDLLSSPELEKVKECAEESCSILFVDSSRPGKRRWCSMRICGNRIKKAAYRRRQGGTQKC